MLLLDSIQKYLYTRDIRLNVVVTHSGFLKQVFVTVYSCRQDGSLVQICLEANPEKPLIFCCCLTIRYDEKHSLSCT